MKLYTLFLLISISSLLLFVATFNWIMNPYDVFVSPEFAGINEYKSEVDRHSRLSKVYQVERVKPDVIYLASSRGIVVPVDYFSEVDETGFNMSLPGASTYELFRMLQHVQSVSPLKRVVLALDEEFTAYKLVNFSENRLDVNYDGSENKNLLGSKWRDYFTSLFSFNALRSSIRTIKKQKERPVSIDKSKYFSERVYSAGGHRQMFRTMEASQFFHYKSLAEECEAGAESNSDAFIYFDKIVKFAYNNEIDLLIYFSPVHVRMYEVKDLLGLSNDIEKMKRRVVAIVDKKAREYKKDDYPIWDFSGYNSVTLEDVPVVGDKSSLMRWYWEGSHYTEDTAREIFNKIYNRESGVNDFGVELNLENIDRHLNDIKKQHNEYIDSHPEVIDELRSISNSVLGC